MICQFVNHIRPKIRTAFIMNLTVCSFVTIVSTNVDNTAKVAAYNDDILFKLSCYLYKTGYESCTFPTFFAILLKDVNQTVLY